MISNQDIWVTKSILVLIGSFLFFSIYGAI